MTCNQPDRDVPKLRCGYPLPCPHHTATISVGKRIRVETPGTVTANGLEAVTRVAKALRRKQH